MALMSRKGFCLPADPLSNGRQLPVFWPSWFPHVPSLAQQRGILYGLTAYLYAGSNPKRFICHVRIQPKNKREKRGW